MKTKRFSIRVRIQIEATTIDNAKAEIDAGLSESGLIWAYSDIEEV